MLVAKINEQDEQQGNGKGYPGIVDKMTDQPDQEGADAPAHEGLASITLNEDKTVYAIFSKTLTASFVLVDDDAATLSSSTSTCTYYNKESVCSLSSPTLTAKS